MSGLVIIEIWTLYLSHNSYTLKCSAYLRKEKTLGIDKKVTAVGRSLTVLGSTFGVDYFSEEVAGFSPFMVSPRINILFIVSCV